MINLCGADKEWVKETLEKAKNKIAFSTRQMGVRLPFTTIDGVYDDQYTTQKGWWTNGFYAGILWKMYNETKDNFYLETARGVQKLLDDAIFEFKELHHDVGFMWLLSSVADYRITGDEAAKQRGLLAASLLAARFNVKGGYLRAWNHNPGWSIIDSMMNVNLLYWGSENLDDKRFAAIANLHADKTAQCAVRCDGSVKHIIEYDTETGEEIQSHGGQGFGVGSSWTRGQAWAIYGFVLSYLHTGNISYLETAKKVAHYFIANITDDYIPVVDFRAPKEPVIKDSSAGVIAACGLIEIAKAVDENESGLYLEAAIKILRATAEKCADFTEENQQLLNYGTGAYHQEDSHHMSLIYGDYYFLEALIKLGGDDMLFW